MEHRTNNRLEALPIVLDVPEHAVSLHFLYYNFARPHMSLRGRTPAMAAGLANHVWTIAEIVKMIDEAADPIIG